MEYKELSHAFPPVWDERSEILILGSFPSVKSREEGFFYGHPRNRFWDVIAAVAQKRKPVSIEEKRELLLTAHIAVWDVIQSCQIRGSSDSSIREVVPNNISEILEKAPVQLILANGRTAERMYRQYIYPVTQVPITGMPSTSPANAAWSKQRLIESYRDAMQDYIT